MFSIWWTLQNYVAFYQHSSIPSKHFNVVSTLFLGWYDVETFENVKFTMKNVVYVSVEIYNIEQRRINLLYFNVDINNLRQRWNNVVILSVEFHNVDECQNNVLNKTILKTLKRAKKNFLSFKKKMTLWSTALAFDCDRLKRKGNIERIL